MGFSPAQEKAIHNSKKSVTWFLSNFGKLRHPSAGILPFRPFSYQQRAIQAFRKHRLNIFRKCRQCFSGESMVWGPNGPKRIDTIEPGDLVYSYNPKLGVIEVVPVLERYENGERECVKVVSKTGHASVATADHNYFTLNGEVEAANLTTNDILLEVNEPERYGPDTNESEAILLGYLLTDGHYNKQIHFTNTCWKYLLDFQKHFQLRFGFRRKIVPHRRDDSGKITSYRIYMTGDESKQWIINLGIYKQIRDQKVIPEQVFRWNNKSIALLLNRMFAGDGWYSGTHCNEAGLCSESLITLNQVKQLLSRFGINSKVFPATKRGMPKLRIFGSTSFARFVEHIGIFGKEPRCPITKGFFFNRKGAIKSVQPAGIQKVYDLRVPPFDNYIVDGAVVHNSGISTISGAFALWFAMFHSNKNILIVSRKNDDAMSFLRQNVMFPFKNLPPWMQDAWAPTKENEHEVIFPNGSKIQSLTSHPDVLRSHSSSLNIIDEAAFIQGMDVMWAAGWPCARGDTLVQTGDGLREIRSLAAGGDPWKHHNITVATDDGFYPSTAAYVSGHTPTVILQTDLGFEFEGTGHHRLRVIDQSGDYVWRELSDILPGDILVSKPDQFVGKRRYLHNGVELTPELAEIIGLYIGDGSLYRSRPRRFKICFDPQDVVTCDLIVDRFNALPLGLETNAYAECAKTTVNLRLNSRAFVDLLIANGLDSKTCPQDASIPDLILQSDRTVLCAFLRGLFDADGWCYQSSTNMKLGMATTSAKLATQVQVALHALGIISHRELYDTTDSRYSDESYWRVEVCDAASKLKFKQIGFITKRKQDCLDAFVGSNEFSDLTHPVLVDEFAREALAAVLGGRISRACSDSRYWNLMRIRRIGRIRLQLVRELTAEFDLQSRLAQYVSRGFLFDAVSCKLSGQCDTFDISVPHNNTYLANGLISHNTLQHGGSVICVSTTCGIGNWYWSTWVDAVAGLNGWNPIMINWWDMDWAIEYKDALSLQMKRIEPRKNIRECTSKEDREKYGPWWSPWLEEQYRALQEQGESWKFDQEILAEFVGSGNTVLPKGVLSHIATTIAAPETKVKGTQTYINAVDGEAEALSFDFNEPDEGLWIWRKPVLATPEKRKGGVIIEPSKPAHAYVMGVDIATGKGRDYSAIEVFDIDTMEQAAEMMVHCLPRDLIKYIDLIGRWYNCALAVIERNNGGDILIDELRYKVMYPRLWRRKQINDKPRPTKSKMKARAMQVAHYGFSTSVNSKPTLNKFLLDYVRDTVGDGYSIYSSRLLKQFETYVRKRDRMGRDTGRTEAEEGVGNYDDLVIAAAMALMASQDIFNTDAGNMVPMGAGGDFRSSTGPTILSNEQRVHTQEEFVDMGGASLLFPMTLSPEELPETSAQRAIEKYAMELGAIPVSQGKPLVVPSKYYYERKK